MNPTTQSPFRAAAYFSTAVFLLGTVGRIFSGAGLAGVALAHLMIFVGVPLFFTAFFDNLPARTVFRLRPLRPSGYLKAIGLGVLCWLMSQSFGFGLQALVDRLGGRLPEYYESLMKAPAVSILIIGAVVPAFCEEFAFRGYLQWNLSGLGASASVLLTGLLFGMMHFSLIRVLPLILLGVVWARVAQRVGSIIPGMLMHLTHNGIALGLTLYVRSRGLTQPQEASPTASLLAMLVAFAMGFALLQSCLMIANQFNKDDAAPATDVAAEQADVARVAAAPERLSVSLMVLALLPGLLMYSYFVVNEIHYVFF